MHQKKWRWNEQDNQLMKGRDSMLNITGMIGRLTKEPNLRYTSNGVAVCTFCLAVDRPGTYGENKKTDYPDCIVWGKISEKFATHCTKGTQVAISGVTTTRLYTPENSDRSVKVTEIRLNTYDVLQGMRKKEQPLPPVPTTDRQPSHDFPTADDEPQELQDEDFPF